MPGHDKKENAAGANKVVLVVGRWQPFHLGHLDLIKRAIGLYGDVILGIGSSNKSNTWENPFTIEERISMIKACLNAEKLSKKVSIVPIPDVGNDELWLKLVQETIPGINVVITGNDWCRRIFSEAGYKVLPPRFFRKEFYNGTRIRDDICNRNEDWRKKVHPTVSRMIDGITGLDDRFRIREGRGTIDGRPCSVINISARKKRD